VQGDHCRIRILADRLPNPFVPLEKAEVVTAFGVIFGNPVDQCVPCSQSAVPIPDGVGEDTASITKTNSYR